MLAKLVNPHSSRFLTFVLSRTFRWLAKWISSEWLWLVFWKAVPELGKTNGSVLSGRSSDNASLPDPPPFPFLPSSANVWSERARKWLCDRYLMTSLYWWVPPRGQDAVVRPLLKKSLFYDIFESLSSLARIAAACSTGIGLWSSLGRQLYYHFSQLFVVYNMS